MKSWKTTTNRKKIQRHINAVIRALNKNIWNDPLWKGRFYMQQTRRLESMSDDYSWLYMSLEFKFVDRETACEKYVWFRKEDFMGSTWRIWEAMNDFIVIDCRVWEAEERPTRETTIDYRWCHKW